MGSVRVGVKCGQIAVFEASSSVSSAAGPSTEIIRGGLRRTLLPRGLELLRAAGIQQGEVFILVLDNNSTSVACMLAAVNMRCVCVLLGVSRIGLLQHVVKHTKVTTIVTVRGETGTLSVQKQPGEDSPAWTQDPAIHSEGGVCMLTSGSVGEPKVAACSWEAMRLQGQSTHEELFPEGPARIICGTSISHAYSINAIFTLLTSPYDEQSELCFVSDVKALYDLIAVKHDKRTVLYGTPATYTQLLRLPAKPLYVDVPYSAGTRLSLELFQQTAQHSGLCVMQNYGSTETGDIAAWYLHGKRSPEESKHMIEAKETYVGTLWPGVRVQVEESTEEVLVWTPWQSMGYVVTGELRLRNGAPHRTADRGREHLASNGVTSLWLQGRIRPSIQLSLSGLILSMRPEQIEQVFLTHEDVTDVLALMPVANPASTLRLRVVLRDGCTLNAKELNQWGAEELNLPPDSVEIELVGFLPCSPAGKLMYT
ncbi:hypothetical protein Poli38472_002320 [Pythium oligandrum]|uniref:AMP-dependent synthetase/ligase domain-containing protein n=1 Tax=Pythium oligandrum TaxID=41045 RepID=A0A8K1CHX5_PYTOL|nr:hypothetical protein Poli38472_002320 [Pythium oligandrum]|eukprot:TMW63379.1 hypothetical protein Poli38472_002320 [Pythium oligandrum]